MMLLRSPNRPGPRCSNANRSGPASRILARWFCLVLAAVATFTTALPATAPAASAEALTDLSIFEGDWRLVDQERARVHRERAIEDAVSELNWVLRKMAAPRLAESTAPPGRMQFYRRGKQLRQRVVEAKGTRERSVEIGSVPSHARTSDGEPFEAAWSLTGTGLQLDWKQHQAYGSNVYRVDPETGSLIVQQTIQITAIDDVAPIVFESRFDRRATPAVSAQSAAAQP